MRDQEERRRAARLAESLGLAMTALHHPVLDVGGDGPNYHCSCGKAQCAAIGKHPRWRRFYENPPRHRRDLDNLVSTNPMSNLGVVTGAISRCVVLDVDPRHGGGYALDLWEAGREGGPLPPTFTVETPSGGFHLYFRLPLGEVVRQAPLLTGVDVRGDRGVVVFPPSVGANGREYRVRPGCPLELAPCPEDVLRQVRKADLAGNGVPLHLRHVVNEPLYAAQMREKALMNVALAPRGRRNETLNLNSYGLGILAGMGWLDVAEVARLLVAAGTASGLDPNEVRATVRSGLGEGVRQVAPEQADFVQRLVDEVGRR